MVDKNFIEKKKHTHMFLASSSWAKRQVFKTSEIVLLSWTPS